MNSNNKSLSKFKWSPQEQSLLRSLREMEFVQSWKKIAATMNSAFSSKNRSGKQCRQRYMNYVRFGQETPKISGWTPKQDELLFRKYMQVGAKWVQIGRQMPGRSENCLKNRFYGTLRKIIRKLNRRMKQTKQKQKNTIKADLLIKILQYQGSCCCTQNQREFNETKEFLVELKNCLVKMAVEPDEESDSQDVEDLLKKISRFGVMVKQWRAMKQNNERIKKDEIRIGEDEDDCQDCCQDKEQEVGSLEEGNPSHSIEKEVKAKIIKNLILHSNPTQNVNEKSIGAWEPKFNNINFGKENKQELI